MQEEYRIQWEFKHLLNKVKPPADASIFQRKFFEQARKKSGANTPRRI
jgi:hypothetical protein